MHLKALVEQVPVLSDAMESVIIYFEIAFIRRYLHAQPDRLTSLQLHVEAISPRSST